jgi:hypothetical protein
MVRFEGSGVARVPGHYLIDVAVVFLKGAFERRIEATIVLLSILHQDAICSQ